MTHTVRSVALIAALAAAGCSGDSGPRASLAATPGDSAKTMAAAHALISKDALAQLDSGNASFRRKEYDAALGRYHKASGLAPQHAAPFFGIYMVGRATGNTKLADSAIAEIRKRNGELPPATSHQYSDSTLKDLHKKAGAKLPNSGT